MSGRMGIKGNTQNREDEGERARPRWGPPLRATAAFERAVTWRGARRAAGVRTRYRSLAAAPDVFCAGARREGVSVGLLPAVAVRTWAAAQVGHGVLVQSDSSALRDAFHLIDGSFPASQVPPLLGETPAPLRLCWFAGCRRCHRLHPGQWQARRETGWKEGRDMQ